MAKGMDSGFFRRCEQVEQRAGWRLGDERRSKQSASSQPDRAGVPADAPAHTHAEQIAVYEAWTQCETPVARKWPQQRSEETTSKPATSLQRRAPVGGSARKVGGAKRDLALACGF